MSLLLKYKDRLNDTEINWLEWHMQAHIVKKLRQHPNYKKTFALAGDQNDGHRTSGDGARRKACGLENGEPDLRFYLDGGRLVLIELKRYKKGRLSDDQDKRLFLLKGFGFDCHVVWAKSPVDAYDLVFSILDDYGIFV